MGAAALVGAFVSAYLLDKYVTGGPIACGLDPSAGCDIVRASKWAYVFDVIPRPALGLVFYAPFFVLLCVRAITDKYANRLRQLTRVLAAIGAIESVYLVLLQAFTIKAYCLWCIASSAAAFVIAAMAIYDKKEDLRSMSAFRETRWYLVMFLIYAPVAAIVFWFLTL